MAYTDLARAERRCMMTTKLGRQCRNYACWGSVRCVSHGGHNTTSGRPKASGEHTRYIPCRCKAYAWPHRPGSGGCRWPKQTPAYIDRTPQGKRRNGKQIRQKR